MSKKKKINNELGAPSEHLREQEIEDVQRISNILDQRTKKDKKKNPFLNPKGGIDLIERFPAYEKKKIKKRSR